MSLNLTPEKGPLKKKKKKVHYYRKRGLLGGRHKVIISHDIRGESGGKLGYFLTLRTRMGSQLFQGLYFIVTYFTGLDGNLPE